MPLKFQDSSTTDPTIKLVFAGDIMQLPYDRAPKLSPKLRQLIQSSDFFIANCEAPIVDKPLNDKIKRYVNFSMPLDYFQNILEQIALPYEQLIIGVANNHSRDETQEIFDKGIDLLKNKLGVNVAGDYSDSKQPSITVHSKRNFNLGVCSWTHLMNGEICLDKRNVVYRAPDILSTDWLKEKKQKKIDFLLGLPHWDREYQHFPHKRTKQFARQFIKDGFDLLIGAHPHVIQPLEIIDNKLCCYSMGNFCSTDRRYETKLIPILEVDISSKDNRMISYHMHFFIQLEDHDSVHLLPIEDMPPNLKRKYWKLINLMYTTDDQKVK